MKSLESRRSCKPAKKPRHHSSGRYLRSPLFGMTLSLLAFSINATGATESTAKLTIDQAKAHGVLFSESEYWFNRTYSFSFDEFELSKVKSVHATYNLAEGHFFTAKLAKENGEKYVVTTGLENKGTLKISIHCDEKPKYYQIWL